MAVTQADIDALKQALATGEKMVRQGDKWVEYRSVDDILKAIDRLQGELTAQANQTRPKQTLLSQGGRGFCR